MVTEEVAGGAVTLVLGVDGGGTKTHALVADLSGTVHGIARDGPSNWESIGLEVAGEVIRAVVLEAIEAAGANPSDVGASTYGLGGIDWPADVERLDPLIGTLGISGPRRLVNDSFVAMRAGTDASCAVVIVAGTGSVAAGRNEAGQTYRTLGLGASFGDFGSAGDVTWEAVAAVARAHTGAGEQTVLRELLLQATGTSSAAEMLEALSRNRIPLPSGAPLVVTAAEDGDAVAREILRRVGRSLGASGAVVARQLGILDRSFEVVLAGGLFRGGSRLLLDSLRGEISRVAPRAVLTRVETPPVVGATLMAMDLLGMAPSGEVRERLSSVAAFELEAERPVG